MPDGGQQRRLPAQPLLRGQVAHPGGTRAEPLERHHVTAGQLVRPPHLTGSAEAEQPLHAVPGERPRRPHRDLLRLPGYEARQRRRSARRVVHRSGGGAPAGSRSRSATTGSTSRSGTRASALGHQTRDPMSKVRAGTSTERTTSVSSSTPKATTKPTSAKATRGSTPGTENVPASTMPAEVITPPVTASPRSIPRRVPTTAASSRTRLIRKML